MEILLNDRQARLRLGTAEVFAGRVPSITEGRHLLLPDLNEDARSDLLFADQGMDTNPFPGYQNTLMLSAPGGKLVHGTANLPQQWDQTHSAAAADSNADVDMDLYVGNLGGGGRPLVLPKGDGSPRSHEVVLHARHLDVDVDLA